MKLNKEEIYTGIAHSLPWIYFQGWWGILSAILSGSLWAIGGADDTSKNWRRIGCPLVICLPILLKTWWAIPIGLLLHLTLRLGYGIPDLTDDGSMLGRFWYGIVPNEGMATVGVRTTIAMLSALCFLPLAWISFIPYLIGGLLLIVLIPIIVDRT